MEARQRLLLVRPFSSRFTLAATAILATLIRTALVLQREGVSVAFRMFPVALLQVLLPVSL